MQDMSGACMPNGVLHNLYCNCLCKVHYTLVATLTFTVPSTLYCVYKLKVSPQSK